MPIGKGSCARMSETCWSSMIWPIVRMCAMSYWIRIVRLTQKPMTDLSSLEQGLTDGLGAWRVAEYINPTPAELLRLRPAQPNDTAFYFDWVRDVEGGQQARNSVPISWQTHQEWFRGKLAGPYRRLFVLEAGALP